MVRSAWGLVWLWYVRLGLGTLGIGAEEVGYFGLGYVSLGFNAKIVQPCRLRAKIVTNRTCTVKLWTVAIFRASPATNTTKSNYNQERKEAEMRGRARSFFFLFLPLNQPRKAKKK